MDIIEELYNTPNIDRFGLLTEANGDGGDTVHREGALMFGLALRKYIGISDINIEVAKERARAIFEQLIRCDGHIRRHVDESKWYGAWDRGSRDQYFAIIGIGLAFQDLLQHIFKGHLKRFLLFTTNTKPNTSSLSARWKVPDLTGTGFWALYIRLFEGSHRFRWLLPLFDLSLLANAIIWRYYRGRDKNDSDVWNVMQALLLSEVSFPTFVSKLAVSVFKRLPKLEAASPVNSVQQRLNHYTRDGGVAILARVFEPVTEHFFA